MAKMSVEQILAYLQKRSLTNGDSVFAHLAHLIQQIIYCQPDDAIDMLETSLLLKLTRFVPEEAPKFPRTWKDTKEEKFIEEFIALQSIPDKKPPPPPPAEGEAPPEEEPEPEEFTEYTADNFLSDSNFYETVGVGLGRSETYQVCLAFRKLAASKVVSKARFFGKFFGLEGNYFVFETTSEPLPEPEGEEEGEGAKKGPWGRPVETIPPEKATGPNQYTYWVCSLPGAQFYRLPDVTPLQIKTARQVKKFLTGNLKAEVSAFPPFPGVEENYLRAQIARISATTELAPKGFFKVPEEEGGEGGGDVVPAEEYAPIPMPELATPESWSHKNGALNLQGRTKLFKPEPPEGEGGEEGEPKEETPPTPEEQEVLPERLATIDTDKDLPDGGGKAWTIVMSSTHKSLKHQILCIRSVLWPGAYTITTPTGFSNIYIGWGIKNRPYVPPLPPPVLKEFEGLPLESRELPPIPKPPEPEKAEGEEEAG